MKRLVFAAVVLAMLVSLAPAVDNNFFNWNTYRQFDYLNTPTGRPWGLMYRTLIGATETTDVLVPRDSNMRWCGNLRWGPPGHQHPVLPYSQMWAFAVAESGVGWSATELICQWRWRTWYPGDYSTIYRGPWTSIWAVIGVEDTLFAAPIWPTTPPGDSLGWFGDIEFRVYGGVSNDSSYLSLGVTSRTWK